MSPEDKVLALDARYRRMNSALAALIEAWATQIGEGVSPRRAEVLRASMSDTARMLRAREN